MRLLLRRLLVLILLVAVSQAEKQPSAKTIFELDLRPLGLDQQALKRFDEFEKPELAFLNDGTIAVSFLTKNENTGLSLRSDPKGGKYLFSTVFVNSAGGVVATQSWHNMTYFSMLLPLKAGRFLIRSETKLSLYYPDLKLVAEKNFPESTAWPGDSYPKILVSPWGSQIYVLQAKYKEHQIVEVLDPNTLRTTSSFPVRYFFRATVAQDSMAFSYSEDSRSHVFWKQGADEPRAVSISDQFPGCVHAEFIRPDRLLISIGCTYFKIIDRAGNVLFHRDLGNEKVGPVKLVTDKFFVVTLYKESAAWIFRPHPRVTKERYAYIDSETFQEIRSVPFNPKLSEVAEPAFSPDGSRIAFIENTSLKVCKVF